ncbi:MAG TPA: SdrD B-like domain-containing protein [Thermoanaerobaculia bacterium]|nr:SdrD B-like domain-containing protein [Thermoanaerobaculia bacterium]
MTLRRVGLAVFVFAVAAGAALAQIPGSIRTVDEKGGAQDLFAERGDVFLAAGSGAPPCRSVELLADGAYYFQVTSATGDKLLSPDPVSERRVTVKNGVIFSYDGTTHAADGKTGCNSLSVALSPYDDAGFRKAAYLVWVTPVGSFSGKPTDVGPVCGDGCFFGFRPELSTTHAFRVENKRNCEPTFCVAGTIYSDANGDGVRQTGEAGQPDVAVRVAGPLGAFLSGYSGAGGTYQVCGLTSSDTFFVHEAVPDGFKQTGPRDRRISKALIAKDLGYIVQVCCVGFSGLDFGNQLIPGSIGGLVYEDLNASGARDAGEPPLSGATVTLTPTDPAGSPQTAVSGADGTFLFQKLAAGTYSLTQSAPAGFTQTQPATDGYQVTLASGASSLNNNFGDFRGVLKGSVAGFVFNDLNGNGVRDGGEPGMAGVTITLASPPSGYPTPSVISAADGSFQFLNLPLAAYTLSETVPAGFKQTAPPPPGTITATLDFAHQNITGLLFGKQALSARIFGNVFVDANGNGTQDPGDSPQSGVVVQLQGSSGPAVSKTTGSGGTYSFDGLEAGTYTISELVPSGYVQTAPPPPGTFTVTAAKGDSKGPYAFGNALAPPATGSISGDKWFDLNANGVIDGADYPLSGIVFVLTDSGGVQRTTTSGADGKYSFTNLPAGTYDLKEVLPPNFFQTFPGTQENPKSYTITLAPSENKTGFRFLNKC